MAAPSNPRPWRSLIVLLALLVGLAAWAFWPGNSLTPKLGLDLSGGTQVILTPLPITAGQPITDVQIQQAQEIIRKRVNGLGVTEAEISVVGSNIMVSVPGVTSDRLVELVGRTALLDFRAVQDQLPPQPLAPEPTPSPSPTVTPSPTPGPTQTQAPTASATKSASASANLADSASPSPTVTPTPSPSPTVTPTPSPSPTVTPVLEIVQAPENDAAYQERVLALDCTNPETAAGGTPDDPTLWLGTCLQGGGLKYNLQPAFIRGTNVASASAQPPQQGVGGWSVNLTFDSEGAKALTKASQELVALPDCQVGTPGPCNAFAIVLDGVVVSSPRFDQAIIGGNASITGDFDKQSAEDLANVLNYGALPVKLEISEVTSVSPTLGADQLRGGIIAGIIGLVLVMLYLLLYYRALGVIAALSLILAGGMTYAAFVGMGNSTGLALTLASIAGAIVSIGITADSFIVYFERIRDEIREGKSLRQATDAGWARARRTLLAADFVSILAAVVLFFLAIGGVQGFAFALGLTTVIDVVVAFLFTRPLVVLFGRTGWLQRGSAMTGLDPRRLGGRSLVASTTKGRKSVAATKAETAEQGVDSHKEGEL
ncbi:MAG: protein translocase subunit SecD [Actinobacteria bacterium]|nr:protein translocase subunit SecD [Actinomycetota bacterium]